LRDAEYVLNRDGSHCTTVILVNAKHHIYSSGQPPEEVRRQLRPFDRSGSRMNRQPRPVLALLLSVCVGVLLSSCFDSSIGPPTPSQPFTSDDVPFYTYDVVAEYPHDEQAFTQGLLYLDGLFYESTGQWGSSSIRRVDPATGEVLQSHPVPEEHFGEGLTNHGTRLIQLTWLEGIAFVYDLFSFAVEDTLVYEDEGWGLTSNGVHLIMSDGSDTLFFRDPDSFDIRRKVAVKDGDSRVSNLNELEYIGGRIFANVYPTNRIAVIDPDSGALTNWIDLTNLMPVRRREERTGALNGIAFDRVGRRLFVTGKNWPSLFEIELVAAQTRR